MIHDNLVKWGLIESNFPFIIMPIILIIVIMMNVTFLKGFSKGTSCFTVQNHKELDHLHQLWLLTEGMVMTDDAP